jgi:hypothetical protein
MKPLHSLLLLAGFAALSTVGLAAEPAAQPSPPPGETAAGQVASPHAAAPASQGLPKVCLDTQSDDALIKTFADRLRETIAASGTLSIASGTDTCSLQLHVPGNLLRFQTAGGVMVSAVVIVTSPSDRYLSASISACQASDLEPCAIRAVAAAKLALLVPPGDGT